MKKVRGTRQGRRVPLTWSAGRKRKASGQEINPWVQPWQADTVPKFVLVVLGFSIAYQSNVRYVQGRANHPCPCEVAA